MLATLQPSVAFILGPPVARCSGMASIVSLSANSRATTLYSTSVRSCRAPNAVKTPHMHAHATTCIIATRYSGDFSSSLSRELALPPPHLYPVQSLSHVAPPLPPPTSSSVYQPAFFLFPSLYFFISLTHTLHMALALLPLARSLENFLPSRSPSHDDFRKGGCYFLYPCHCVIFENHLCSVGSR